MSRAQPICIADCFNRVFDWSISIFVLVTGISRAEYKVGWVLCLFRPTLGFTTAWEKILISKIETLAFMLYCETTEPFITPTKLLYIIIRTCHWITHCCTIHIIFTYSMTDLLWCNVWLFSNYIAKHFRKFCDPVLICLSNMSYVMKLMLTSVVWRNFWHGK